MASGGIPSARGFEYQIEASVWITLELMLRARQAREVEVEPPNAEDLQAMLSDDDVYATVRATGANGYRAMFQMKTRSTGPWGRAALQEVIGDGVERGAGACGPAPRASALELLCKDSRSMYFLVTDAAINGDLHKLGDQELACAPSTHDIATHFLAKKIKHEADALRGRIGLLPGKTREVIRFRTERLLNHVAKVPQVRLDECIGKLVEAFRVRLIGDQERAFRYEQLVDILRACEGLPSPTGKPYVPPKTIDAIRARFERDHVILLVGQPGIGKTALAEHLAMHYRSTTPPYRTVQVSADLDRLSWALQEHGPAVIIVVDPWGNSKARSDTWLGAELPNLVGRASSDKRIIITTRDDIYATVLPGVDGPLQPYEIHFDDSHYDSNILWQIVLDNAALSPHKADLIQPHRRAILKALRLPKALERFGAILKGEARSMHDSILPYFDPDPVFDDCYFDANSNLVDGILKRTVDEVFGGNVVGILEQWADAPIEHATLFWLLCEAGGAAPLWEVQQLAGEMNGRFGTSLTVTEYASFLCRHGIAEQDGDAIRIHSYALSRMEGMAQDRPTRAGQLVTYLAGIFVARQKGELSLSSCYRALATINTFGQDLSATVGWRDLALDIDRIIQEACQAPARDDPASPQSLTDEEWGDNPDRHRYENMFEDGVDAGFMWRWPQSELTTLVRRSRLPKLPELRTGMPGNRVATISSNCIAMAECWLS